MERAATQEPGHGGGASAPAGRGPQGPGAAWQAGRLRLRLPSELTQLRVLRRQVEGWSTGQGITQDELIDLQLAIGEAVSNGIEHGYRDRPNGPIEVELEIRPATDGSDARMLDVRVVDHGRWRPAPARPGHRGRGLAMIRNLSSDMCVTSHARGTVVTFSVRLNN
jgi:anti-sigma regulatory factor (Ser/Thr protein kinase)